MPMAMTPKPLKPLLVIPVFNNRGTVLAVMRAAASHCRDILVVDDGSDDGTAEALRAAAEEGAVPFTLFTQPRNMGKGAALKAAFHWALAHGFTHALSMDADGQHAAADLPALLAAMAEHPEAVILGARDFTASRAGHVPRSSRVGRAISNFWVWVETGLPLPDTQTGLRVYPLARLPLAKLRRRRFDFEIEVLVKAWRDGAPLRSVPVSVHYPPPSERISHFRAYRDTLRLTSLHAGLTVSRLWTKRRPEAVVTLAPQEARPPGARALPERRGAALLPFFMKRLPFGLCYALVPPVLMFYFLTGARARRGMLDFHARLGVRAPFARWRAAFRNYLFFSASLLDRMALTVGAWDGTEAVTPVAEPDMGAGPCLIVGAHYGDQFFSALAFVRKQRRPVAIVMDKSVNPTFQSLLERARMPHVTVLDSSRADLDFLLRLKERADQGHSLCFLADRPGPQGSVIDVRFLGEKVPFAALPFKLAERWGWPLYAFFCTKSRWAARAPFRFEVQRLGNAGEDAAALAQAFARTLEARVRREPQHWFNFQPLAARPAPSAASAWAWPTAAAAAPARRPVP